MTHHRPAYVTRFALAAFVGTVAIIVFAPLIRPKTLPPWLEETSRWIRSQPQLARIADALSDAFAWSPSIDQAAPPVKPAVPRSTAAPRTTSVPAPSPTFPAYWGVVRSARAPVYSANGKFLRNCSAGMEVSISGVRKSSAGRLAECMLGKATKGGKPVLLRCDSLNVYSGTLDSISPDNLARYRQLAQLQANVKALSKDESHKDRTDNPHVRSYQQAKAAYQPYREKVDQLVALREQATGDERMKWEDELRRLRGDGIRLGKAYEDARSLYTAWNTAHPRSAATNPKIQAAQRTIASLTASLQEPTALP